LRQRNGHFPLQCLPQGGGNRSRSGLRARRQPNRTSPLMVIMSEP
jgi:hypothetical protein